MSNSTCFSPKAPQEGPPFFLHGNIVFQAHDVGWIVTGFFSIVATITSLWLVNKHLQWYTNKREQRYIVRILFMVPIYALISFASYLFWNHSTPLLLIRDGYESTVLTSFFYLLLTYLSPLPDEQKAIFLKVGLSKQADREATRKGETVRKWVIPLSFIKAKPADGLYFLQVMKWGVLQYCVIRPTTTLVAVILNYFGLYCNDSFSPRWGHVYITIIVSVSVSIAMYCLIQLYIPVAGHLVPHKPILKLFAVKAVVFLTFWQATLLSGLGMFGLIKDTQYMTADDINTGWSAIIETFEMMLFAFLHVRAFSYKPYRTLYYPNLTDSTPPIRTSRLRSLGHAFDFRETFREIWVGCIYISDRVQGVEPRPDVGARRMAMMEAAFGRARLRNTGRVQEMTLTKAVEVRKDVDVDVDVSGERQWLGLGDDYAYGLGYASRQEKSDGLCEAIEKELDKRGVQLRDPDGGVDERHQRTNGLDPDRVYNQPTSWWRSMYNRLSQPGSESTDEKFANISGRNSGPQHRSQEVDRTSLLYEYDDAPPLSIIHAYRSNRQSQHSRNIDDWDLLNLNMAISRPIVHVQEPADAVSTSKRHVTPLRRTSNSSSPLFERPDSLLARVFLPRSPAMSSIELGSAASALSHDQSSRDPGTQTRSTKLRLLTNSSVVVTAEHISEHGRDVDPGSRSLLLSSSVEPGLVPPPISPKLGPRRSPKCRESPGWPDDRPSRSSHRRESASHLCSHPLSSRLSSMPPSGPEPNHPAPPAIERSENFFNVMDQYMAGDSVHQMQTSRELTATLDVPVQPYSATEPSPSRNHPRFNNVSPSYQAAEIYQLPTVAADPNLRPPGLLRARYHRPPAGTRNLRRMSAPMEISPQFITMPLAAQGRNDFRFCHSMNNANAPTPLAPPPPSSHSRSPRDTCHAYYPGRRSSNLTRSPLASKTLASSAYKYSPSTQYNVKHITNSLPSSEVRPHRTRYHDSAGVDI
ncbi:hypothetical protein PILCRDRAFT_826947 [Piloderma croceum F 1598]|uniref:DUF300-domain-containing protein n=1 Tax=Piloderma croceum (strain F 1598) TaxID=765440 RepID=A0A0C3ETD7_PILCF|nr:hypothetical protein PILCRDRAFT_826947 [Piloderma croceum F 1598]